MLTLHDRGESPQPSWLEGVLEAIPDPIFLKDGQGRWQRLNQAALDLFQLDRVECQGRTDAEIAELTDFYRETLLTCLDSDEAAWTQRRSIRIEAVIPQPIGAARTFDFYKVPLFHTEGHRQGLVVVGRDITERKQAELALRESEQRFRTVFKQAQIGIAVCAPPDFSLGMSNPFFWEFTGYGPDELAQMDFAAITHPEDLAIEQELLDACLTQRQSNYQLEKRYLRKDGQVRWGRLNASLTWDEQGQLQLLLAMVQDIHDRKLAEATLQERDDQLRSIFDHAMVGMALIDPSGCVIAANEADCRFLGYSQAELIGRHFSEFTYPEDLTLDQQLYQSLLQGILTSYVIDKRYLRKDRTVVWGRLSVSLVRNADHSVRYTVIVCEDITDRKQTEENLRRYERMVAATPDGMALLDRNYCYLAVNQTYLDWHQKSAERVIGYTVAEVMGEKPFTQTLKPYLDYALAGRVVRHQEWCTSPSLGQQFISVTYAPYADDQGGISGVVLSRRNLTDLKQAEIALQQLAERELLLATINNRMRQSLDLKSVLQTAVSEVRAFLQTDRVLVYRLNARGNGTVVAESVAEGWISLADFIIRDPCLSHDRVLTALAQGKVHAIADVGYARLNPCYGEMLEQFQVQANLALPLLQGDRVWGLLIAHHCQAPRHWLYEEIDLLKQLAGQLAIAIQQSELYRQVQDLNTDLEHQVTIRTAELLQAIQFDELLKRITDKVRDGLDEQQILQTVVQELVQGMSVECCYTGIYNKSYTTSTITNEFIRDLKSALGTTIEMATAPHPEVYADLLQGKTCIFGDLVPDPLRSDTRLFAILACPIVDDQKVLGDLWVFKHRSDIFNEQEIRLVQQVANQCAIALRQSRLYQAAQTQVLELGRLNQLKDDFLSTVSHELRTPMSNIKMATQMLEIQLTSLGILGATVSEGAKLAQVNRYFKILQEECQRETTLINDLLDLTRIDINPDPFHAIQIELHSWLFLIVEPFSHRIRSQQQTLDIHIPKTLTLETDLTYLERILRELLNNACKYTPRGETISITAQAVAMGIELRIGNTGVEIPPAEFERVFDRFYRIPSHDPWQHGGTGLGLALAKRFIEFLGGTIRVESASNLTEFVLNLPTHLPKFQPGR
ncbi:PAS domain S-box protein [Trichothermofontia sp.]